MTLGKVVMMAALKDWLISQRTGKRFYRALQSGGNKTPGLALRVQIARETQTSEVVKKKTFLSATGREIIIEI